MALGGANVPQLPAPPTCEKAKQLSWFCLRYVGSLPALDSEATECSRAAMGTADSAAARVGEGSPPPPPSMPAVPLPGSRCRAASSADSAERIGDGQPLLKLLLLLAREAPEAAAAAAARQRSSAAAAAAVACFSASPFAACSGASSSGSSSGTS